MDHFTFTQMAVIAVAGVVDAGLVAAAIVVVLGDRPERPLAALRGRVIQARRSSATLPTCAETQIRGDAPRVSLT